MKKHLLIIAAILPALLQVQSQEALLDTNKMWSTLVQQSFPPPSYQTSYFTKVSGDTLIQGEEYLKVWNSEDSLMLQWDYAGLIREDTNQKVFYWPVNHSYEMLIYDFDLQVGDTVELWDNPNSRWILDDIDSVFVYDKYVQRFSFNSALFQKEGTILYPTTWYEGIGDLAGLLHSGMGSNVGVSFALLCYYEDDVVKYHHPAYSNCYMNVVGVDSHPKIKNRVGVFPNPVVSTSRLEFGSSQVGESEVFIYSATGQLVLKQKSVTGIEVKNDDFEPGIYFYVIILHESVQFGKFVVR